MLEVAEVRWTNQQPFVVLEARLPAFYRLFPRFSFMQTEKIFLLQGGEWKLDERPYDPAVSEIMVEQLPPEKGKRYNPCLARYLVRVPQTDEWRLEIDSFEKRLFGYPLSHKQTDKDFHWRSAALPGASVMLQHQLTNAQAVWQFAHKEER